MAGLAAKHKPSHPLPMNLRMSDMEKVARTIHVGGVGGLGDEIQEQDMAEFFGQYGEVTAVRISGRFAWVEFLDVRAANAALALDGETTGGHHLRVSQSKSAIHSNGLKKRAPAGAPQGGPTGDGMDSLTDAQRQQAMAMIQAGGGGGGGAGAPSYAGGGGGGGYGYAPQQGYPPPQYGGMPPQFQQGPPQGYGGPPQQFQGGFQQGGMPPMMGGYQQGGPPQQQGGYGGGAPQQQGGYGGGY